MSPMNFADYPPDWPKISRRIRLERAQGKCEWCGVLNGAYGARDKNGDWHNADDIRGMNHGIGEGLFGDFPRMMKIVLTVAHLGTAKPDGTPGDKHDKMDVRDENLAALCQRCHLNYDRDDHVRHAMENRDKKRGQTRLELS